MELLYVRRVQVLLHLRRNGNLQVPNLHHPVRNEILYRNPLMTWLRVRQFIQLQYICISISFLIAWKRLCIKINLWSGFLYFNYLFTCSVAKKWAINLTLHAVCRTTTYVEECACVFLRLFNNWSWQGITRSHLLRKLRRTHSMQIIILNNRRFGMQLIRK